MKEIVILSGKGGTGKTSVTASFACLADNPVLVDCDVDAADLHLVLEPSARETHEFSGGKTARMTGEKCAECGRCVDLCRFDAITDLGSEAVPNRYVIDSVACEGCGICASFCGHGAIVMEDAVNGQWFKSETRVGTMVHARLGAGEENSGKLVTLIRREAEAIAKSEDRDIILVDGPPGIGCPVIASLSGANIAVVVTEPTVSGIHDLKRVAQLAAHFKVLICILINKADINPEQTAKICRFAEEHGLEVLGEIPYDPVVTKAQLAGQSVIEFSNGSVSDTIRTAWSRLLQIIT